ncbi:hypothetical protein [Geminocystis sp. NIES-3709]|uniref:hypothetical protein n=1 Tax=Geminocystis sp. NIES-3709 TaxID=1617448 RepID=UPI0005FC7A54|nr:hypothetical protein [Geminocystis sp. NIES-3709]BAQ64925.1 hypothetical protein GM3709_1690 [Geminocystis sp. NIES-3709]
MLIEFQVGNFLSFKNKVTFSMIASDIDNQNEELDENNLFVSKFDENYFENI